MLGGWAHGAETGRAKRRFAPNRIVLHGGIIAPSIEPLLVKVERLGVRVILPAKENFGGQLVQVPV